MELYIVQHKYKHTNTDEYNYDKAVFVKTGRGCACRITIFDCAKKINKAYVFGKSALLS